MDKDPFKSNKLTTDNEPVGRWRARQAVYGEVLDALDRVFACIPVEYMPLKGAHLICSGIAEKMASREMIDIDLLVRPSVFEDTLEFLSSHGSLIRLPPDPWSFEQPFVYLHGRHRVRFELHSGLNRPERFFLDVDAMFDRAALQTSVRRIMTPEDALLILICHTLVHLVDGIRDQVYEEALLLSGESAFSWERFSAVLRSSGIERFAKALLTLAGRKAGLMLPHQFKADPIGIALLSIKSPRRGRGVLTLLFRCLIELSFVKSPLSMAWRYIRKKP